jgi:site-specific recombinase XerD
VSQAAIATGQGLPMIGKLLGHAQVQTTARYAHLAADPVKLATKHVSAKIGSLLGGRAA